MYYPIEGGSVEVIEVDGGFDIGVVKYQCQLPPVGYGKNRKTGEIEYVGVRSSSTKKSEQIWERLRLPEDWLKLRKKEAQKQTADADYFDPELEKIRNKWWKHRLCGDWIMINGKATYIPPSFWVYLTCAPIDIGYPTYRNTDKKFFYVWELCCEDPRSAGLADIERRRMGKTFKCGSIGLDRASIYDHHHTGIQSKTNQDAKQVFSKTIVNFFKKYPDFFRPIYDQSKGVTPTTELRFFQTTKKGKRAEEVLDADELESWIDFGSSDIFYYDGSKLNTYIMDEFGKTKDIDVWDRWNVVRFCLDQDGEWIGKALLVSTIEELESGGEAAMKIWAASNPNKRDANGRTQSGLYIFFLPAYETMFFDKFGMPDIKKGREFLDNQRSGLQSDSKALSSIKRKNPYHITEAFLIDGDDCHFNADILNDRRDFLSWNDACEKGNFEWKNGEPYTQVEWVKNRNGRWLLAWNFADLGASNAVDKRGNRFYPKNDIQFISGCDPYQNDITEDTRNSLAASHVLLRFDKANADNNRRVVCQYHSRPSMVSLFYEDMIKQSFYFGTPLLYESNKPGIKPYFIDKGFEPFLIMIPGYKDYGIPSTTDNKTLMVNLLEEYIEKFGNTIPFIKLTEQLLKFDIHKTEKFDLVMSLGWTLVADFYRRHHTKEATITTDINDIFRSYKIPQYG